MTTPRDREQLLILNGSAPPTWKKEPTQINPSLQPIGAPRMVHQSGTNPFGSNPNRQRRIGNQTSTRVLSSGPPRKKVKTEHTPPARAAFGDSSTRQGDGTDILSKRSHEVLLAPEAIDVDDNWDSVMHGDNSYTNNISSPDELNIRSPSTEGTHSSKYQLNTARHGSTGRNNPPIAPDGANTEWASKKFSQGSSHISNRNPASSGQVREKVAKIEAKTHIQKIDLTEKVFSVKMKNRMKKKDHTLFSREPQAQEQPPHVPKKPVLPLKEVYLDDKHHNDRLEIFWLSTDKLSIKSNKRPIFGPLDIRKDGKSLTYHDSSDSSVIHDPIFQLKTYPKANKHGTDVSCLTVKLDCSSPDAQELYYTDLLHWLKTRVTEKEFIRAPAQEKLWEGAARAEASVPTKKGGSGKSNRVDELREGDSQRAKRSLINTQSEPPPLLKRSPSQTSMRFTPKPPSVTVSASGNQKFKQHTGQDDNDLPESVIPRRSTRSTSGTTRSPAIDGDEVILVYPPGVPGAVNITNGDLHRLQPGEFLNDTLIEFGLKLWLKDLEQTNPLLASQIHVFNSFFYKKLNHQKKGTNSGGYESVRKWTSKFDIFQKKYIIVPINEHLHWYFAIICEPEHVLVPAASNIPSTRQTRQSVSEPTITESETPTASKPASIAVFENGRDEDKLGTPSEAEVEHTLHDFQGSCSISNIEPSENIADADGERSPSALSYVSDNTSDHVLRPLSPTASDHERHLLRHSPSLSDEKMAMDVVGDPPAKGDDPVIEIRSVDSASFYAPPNKDKGKRKADPESFIMEIDGEDEEDSGSVLSDTPKTYIFTFDSLGSRHPQAIKRLSAYLKMEAQDKKKIVNAGNAEGKTALVPAQPNFCDCGIYLLHFAQTFMSNPSHYRRMILTPKPKSVHISERELAWNAHQIAGKREELAARIATLSREWKKGRAAKEEAKQRETLNSRAFEVAESLSDGEIDILEPIPSSSKAKSGGKRKAGQAATRLRG